MSSFRLYNVFLNSRIPTLVLTFPVNITLTAVDSFVESLISCDSSCIYLFFPSKYQLSQWIERKFALQSISFYLIKSLFWSQITTKIQTVMSFLAVVGARRLNNVF